MKILKSLEYCDEYTDIEITGKEEDNACAKELVDEITTYVSS